MRRLSLVAVLIIGLTSSCADREPQFQGAHYQKQFQTYLEAAEACFAPAQYKVGSSYQLGAGTPKDLTKAAEWYERAAKQGHARAQYSVAILYGAGFGVPRDYERAYIWYSLAAANLPTGAEQHNATVLLNAIQQYMTPDQVLRAQEQARDFEPRKETACQRLAERVSVNEL